MNLKRLTLAVVVVFVGIWITDFLIHGVCLRNAYAATMSLWRPDADMQAHMGWLMAGELLAAITLVVLWAKGFAGTGSIGTACFYGMCMGLFSQATTLVSYAVQPLPPNIVTSWFVAG